MKIYPVVCFCCIASFICGCSGKGDVKPEGNLLGSSGKAPIEKEADDFSAGELESLTQTGINPLAADSSSDAYRRTYGRSTAPLLPVFFDFDSSSINTDQLSNLNESGNHLIAHQDIDIIIEGNCDERGTNDYNLALGELRAINVKKYLANIGVEEYRITTISYGSQRPLYPGSDEESWAMNRRADLVIK